MSAQVSGIQAVRPARPSLRGAFWPLAVAGIGVTAFGVVLAQDPFSPESAIVCPLYGTTGLLCPGCGGTRAAYALAHGDFLTAFAMHPLVALAAPLLATLWVRWLLRTQGWQLRPWRYPDWMAIAFPVLLLVFSILRNIEPYSRFLGPGPAG